MTQGPRPPQVNIRMPDSLKKSLRLLAKINNRSTNSEIVQALSEYVSRNSEAPTTGNSRGL